MNRMLTALGLALTAGCASSPPTHYYTLDAVPGEHARSAPVVAVQVAVVHIPATLDRRAMVRESAPHRLEISDQNRWGSPFAEMARRVLTEDLLERLPQGSVILPQQPAPHDADQILVDLLRFDADGSGNIKLEGSWSLLSSSNATLLMRPFTLTSSARAADFGQQADAMSALLGQLADQMVAGLPERSPTAGSPAAARRDPP
jgi:uncharacterized protein